MQLIKKSTIELTVDDVKEAIREYVNARLEKGQGPVEWVGLNLGYDDPEIEPLCAATAELEKEIKEI